MYADKTCCDCGSTFTPSMLTGIKVERKGNTNYRVGETCADCCGVKPEQKDAKPNPEGFTDLHKQVCEERCAAIGDPACWRLPDMTEPCEHITPCTECQAEVEMLVDALDRHG